MRVRFLTTGNEGLVDDTTYLPSSRVGDLAGTWYHITLDDTGEALWAHADSVEVIHHDPRDLSFSGPEEAYTYPYTDSEERWYGLHDGWVS